jgi:peroxiredoxin
MAAWGSATGDPSALTALLKGLDLVGYPPGTRAPQFTGDTVETRGLSLSELHGKVVVVNFWATWCLECRPEMPVLEGLQRELASQGLAIIGINAREDTQTVRRYARELGLTFQLVVDQSGTTSRLYGVVGIPTTFVIARDGRAVAFGVGPRDWASPMARALIETLLAEPMPRVP